MGFRTSAPAPNLGYNRTTDWPVAGGVSGSAQINGFRLGGGVSAMANLGTVNPGTGTGTWHPTIAWMLGFVVVELIAFQLLSRYLNL